jgi:hypothetical protein
MKPLRPSTIAARLYSGKSTLWGLEKRGDLPPKRSNLKRSSGILDSDLNDTTDVRRAARLIRYNKSGI